MPVSARLMKMHANNDLNARQEALWAELRRQAIELSKASPVLAGYLFSAVLQRQSFAECISHLLGDAMTQAMPNGVTVTDHFLEFFASEPESLDAAAQDLEKLDAVNPACPNLLTGLLSFRGFQSLQVYRLAHSQWQLGQEQLAALLQNWTAIKYAVDIHPAARIGKRVFIDHGMGLVVGATAVIEDDVNIWHGVTLGSTLTEGGDRHPKVRRGATICAGATVLGNIEIGEGALVAAGSVVLKSVAPHTVVVGIPARPAGPVPTRLDAIDETVKRLATA